MNKENIGKSIIILRQSGILAYPTEAVYGLGCDPFNKNAVINLLKLKQRSVDKGLILVAATWEQVKNLVNLADLKKLNQILASWPGPITWVFPASDIVPAWITGKYSTVALRVSDHPVVRELCSAYGGPIVSTSANVEGFPPARTVDDVDSSFPRGIDFIVPGLIGSQLSPTRIYDAVSGKIIRS